MIIYEHNNKLMDRGKYLKKSEFFKLLKKQKNTLLFKRDNKNKPRI